MDRYYTSIHLAEWLYDKNITCIGTLNSNQKGLPKEIKKQKLEKETVGFPAKEAKAKSL